jgi:hypothetical protein
VLVSFHFNGKEIAKTETIGYPKYKKDEIIRLEVRASARELRRTPTREFRPAYFKVEEIIHQVSDSETSPLGLQVKVVAVPDAEIDTIDGETAIPRRLLK